MLTYIIGWTRDKDIFKLAKRERKSRNLDHIKCIENNDQNVLLKEHVVNERWRAYFSRFLNEKNIGDIRTREGTLLAEHTFFHKITVVKVVKALKQMKIRKAMSPNSILIKGLEMLKRSWGGFG